MRTTIQFFSLLIVLVVLSSCASIVSKSNWPVSFESNPGKANITVVNRGGKQVYKGVTPAVVVLKAGAGFFKKESYTVKFELDGYSPVEMPLECKVNGWYWGNILIGGVIGMLIIDPATGAMYKFATSDLQPTLVPKTTGSTGTEPSLKICSIDQIPWSMQHQLVRLPNSLTPQ